MLRHFLFPASPLNPRMIDEDFQEQAIALKSAGFGTSVVSDANLITGNIPEDATIVYRGWMKTPKEYADHLVRVMGQGWKPFVSLEQYTTAHHFPNWYPLISRWTPESHILNVKEPEALCAEINALGYASVFIKDFVKSIKTGRKPLFACPVQPDELKGVLDNMVKYRGQIEGGLVVREAEDFMPFSEKRYFVINGDPYAMEFSFDTRALNVLSQIEIPSPFYSVDMALRSDGRMRIVEIGDGQVSDLVGWTPERFAAIWKESVEKNVPVRNVNEGLYDED